MFMALETDIIILASRSMSALGTNTGFTPDKLTEKCNRDKPKLQIFL
jgi:hypothetical protein